MTAFAAPIGEPCAFKLGNDLSQFRRHKIILFYVGRWARVLAVLPRRE